MNKNTKNNINEIITPITEYKVIKPQNPFIKNTFSEFSTINNEIEKINANANNNNNNNLNFNNGNQQNSCQNYSDSVKKEIDLL